MAQTKCTRTGVTDWRAALINKWLALPGTKQLGIDSMQKWSFCMSNKVLNKAVHACFETVPSRGLYGEAKSVGVLFLCLLLFPFVLCCALFSLEGWPTGSYSSASAKGSTTALIPLVSSLSVETSTEHWQSKKFLQQVTVISSTNTLSSEYDLSLDIFIFDDSMQVSVKVNHQLLAYILFHSLCVCSFLYLWKSARSRYVRWCLWSVVLVSSTHTSSFVVGISVGTTKLNKLSF